jgi:hypothetical protein
MVSGGIHNAAISSTGELWTWGCNDEKALGRVVEAGQEWLPARVTKLAGKVVTQVCGGIFGGIFRSLNCFPLFSVNVYFHLIGISLIDLSFIR